MLRWLTAAVVLLMWVIPSQCGAAGRFLGELNWHQAEKAFTSQPLVILPFGAGAKEHGPHLPMNADQVMMQYLLQAAVAEADVLVVPPVLHGWLPAFRAFPGTEVADPAVFQNYVHEIARSLVKNGAQRIVFLNTGIRNATGLPLSIVAREIRVEYGVPTLVVSWDDLETAEVSALQHQRAGGHADEIETAIQLYLQPEAVDMAVAVTDYREGAKKSSVGYQPGVFSRTEDDPLYSSTGVFGDARAATSETGRQVLEMMRTNWLKALVEFAQVPVVPRK